MSTFCGRRLHSGCAFRTGSVQDISTTPCSQLRRASTAAAASASGALTLTVDRAAEAPGWRPEVLEQGGQVDLGRGNGFSLRSASMGDTAVAAMLREGQELAVRQLSTEMSQLLAEVEAELSSYLLPHSQPAPTKQTGLASAAASAALLEMSAARPRQTTSIGTSVASTSAATYGATALPSLLPTPRSAAVGLPQLLPPAKTNLAVVSGASAGDRAQRRRRKWQRSDSVAKGEAPVDLAKYKTTGKTSMAMFMGTFTQDHILSAEEEQALAAAAQDYMKLEERRRVLGSLLRRPPSLAELARALKLDLAALGERLECGKRARTLLAQKNYRLVVNIAKRMVRYAAAKAAGGSSDGGSNSSVMEDAVMAGMHGLMRAVERFDRNAGFRLSTYATFWIKQYIQRHLQKQESVINMPDTKREGLSRLRRVRASLNASLHRQPSREEVAAAAGLSVQQVAELEQLARGAAGGVRSLEAPMADDEPGRTLSELLSEEDGGGLGEGTGGSLSVDSEEHYALNIELNATVDSLLSSLDEHDQDVIRYTYDLDTPVLNAAATGGAAAARQEEEEEAEVEADAGSKRAAKAKSGKARLQLGGARRSSLAARSFYALKRLRASEAVDDPRLAEWLNMDSVRRELPVRVPGYAKKTPN